MRRTAADLEDGEHVPGQLTLEPFPPRPRLLSLFSGYGGLDLAVAGLLDADVIAHAEHEPPTDRNPRPTQAAARVLAHRFPGVPNLGDVTAADWSTVAPVDVIAGGFPCQDVSLAGRRLGIRHDTRSGLWAHMAAAVDELRPGLVVIENVRGLLSARAQHPAHSDMEPCPWCMGGPDELSLRALGAVLGDLADLGYDAAWRLLSAADVGAPHGRARVFVVAWPDSDAAAVGCGPARGDDRLRADWSRALLPTPVTSDYHNPPTPERADERAASMVRGVKLSEHVLRGPLLKTPTAQLAVNGGSQHPAKRADGGHGPTLADEIEFLLPTPRATDGTKGGPNQRGSSGDLMLPSAVQLLPTATPYGSNQSPSPGAAVRPSLDSLTPRLLPTPVTTDVNGARNSTAGRRPDHGAHLGDTLTDAMWKLQGHSPPDRLLPTPPGIGRTAAVESRPDVVIHGPESAHGREPRGDGDRGDTGDPAPAVEWGPYAAAVGRWAAVLGRDAPVPTTPGTKGQPRLSPRFVEWMMGLPAGWVTDVPGVTRNDALRLLGNGVVPRQAQVAVAWLLGQVADMAAPPTSGEVGGAGWAVSG